MSFNPTHWTDRHNFAGAIGGALVESAVGSVSVVVLDVLDEQGSDMSLVSDDGSIEQPVTQCPNPSSGRVRGDLGEVNASRFDLDRARHMEPGQHDGVDTHDDRGGLSADELGPRRICAITDRVDSGSTQDVPHAGRSDRVFESVEFALYAASAGGRPGFREVF